MSEVIALRYIGDGAYRPSLPARDLDRDDIAAVAVAQKRTAGELIAEALDCGLYRPTYDVEPDGEPAGDPIGFDKFTKAQLVAMAAEHGIEIGARDSKAVIWDALAAGAAALDAKVSAEEAAAAAPEKSEE